MDAVNIIVLGMAILVLARRAWSPAGVERRTVRPVLIAAAAVVVSYLTFSLHQSGDAWLTANLVLTATAAIVLPIAFVLAPLRGELYVSRALWRGLSRGHHFTPLLCAQAWFVLCYAGLGISLFPLIAPPSITIWEAAAPPSSQAFLLVGAAVLIPVILAYTGFAYWVFRGKVRPGMHYH